ncbi:MAG: hypothetical protein Tsb0021_12610 [Chlamydiales bacterium]
MRQVTELVRSEKGKYINQTFIKLVDRLSIVSKSLLYSIYRPLCLHCFSFLSLDENVLCTHCQSFLDPIDPSTRCSLCFEELSQNEGKCLSCIHSKPIFQQAACWEYLGPGGSLIKALKYSYRPYLSKSIAGGMLYQFLKLDWPKPDVIIPVPSPLVKRMERGYNQCALIAKDMAKGLGIPMVNALKRSSLSLPQASLSQQNRLKQRSDTFLLKKNFGIRGVNILLIDDVLTTGTTIKNCVFTLMEEFPKSIYALAACRSIKLY